MVLIVRRHKIFLCDPVRLCLVHCSVQTNSLSVSTDSTCGLPSVYGGRVYDRLIVLVGHRVRLHVVSYIWVAAIIDIIQQLLVAVMVAP